MDVLTTASLLTSLVRGLTKDTEQRIEEAQSARTSYTEKLESADGPDIFKYVYLINDSSIELYVQQSRQQATASFLLSRRVAVAGFVLLIASVVVGIVSQFTSHPLTAAYLAGLGGMVTEFIAGVFFYLYNRSLEQINGFYNKMVDQQQQALTSFAAGKSEALQQQLEAAMLLVAPANPKGLQGRKTTNQAHQSGGDIA